MLLRDEQHLCQVALIRRVAWLGDLIHGAEWGGELLVRPFEALLISPDIKAAHNAGP